MKLVNVSIDFQMYRGMAGYINGTVSDSVTLLDGAKIYFFFDGIYLSDSPLLIKMDIMKRSYHMESILLQRVNWVITCNLDT